MSMDLPPYGSLIRHNANQRCARYAVMPKEPKVTKEDDRTKVYAAWADTPDVALKRFNDPKDTRTTHTDLRSIEIVQEFFVSTGILCAECDKPLDSIDYLCESCRNNEHSA